MIKKFFRFASRTPRPPAPPARPPAPPGIAKSSPPQPAAADTPGAFATAPSIVGQWREPNAQDRTEFRDDGTVVEQPASGEPIRGRYSLKGDTLKVQIDGAPEELTFTVTLTPNNLEMRYPDGQVTKYERV